MAKQTNTNSATREATVSHTPIGVSWVSVQPTIVASYPSVRADRGIIKRLKTVASKGFTVVEQPVVISSVPNGSEPLAEAQLMSEQDYHDHMPEWATKAANQAYEATLAAGLPVTIAEGNQIIKLFPDGHREVLGTID